MKYLLLGIKLIVQLVVSYLLAFFVFIGTAELFGLGSSATQPDQFWVELVVYTLSALAIGLGMWGVGWGFSKMQKSAMPSLSNFLGAAIGGGLAWAWLQSTAMGQTRSPIILVVGVFLGYYLPDLIKMFSGDKE